MRWLFCRLSLAVPIAVSASRTLNMHVQLIELRPGVQVVKISKEAGSSMEVRLPGG